jgi:microcompartment protein CcmL/EutN
MLDIDDIPRGWSALDLLVKEAQIDVYSSGTVQAGRFLVLFGGEVESTQMALERAMDAASASLRDAVLLPFAEERIAPAILDAQIRWPATGDTLAVFQNDTSPTMLLALDKALKGAEVDLVQLRIAEGLGGRAMATLWGKTHDVEAAKELAESALKAGHPQGWSAQVIRNVDPTVAARVGAGSHFFSGWRG